MMILVTSGKQSCNTRTRFLYGPNRIPQLSLRTNKVFTELQYKVLAKEMTETIKASTHIIRIVVNFFMTH